MLVITGDDGALVITGDDGALVITGDDGALVSGVYGMLVVWDDDALVTGDEGMLVGKARLSATRMTRMTLLLQGTMVRL